MRGARENSAAKSGKTQRAKRENSRDGFVHHRVTTPQATFQACLRGLGQPLGRARGVYAGNYAGTPAQFLRRERLRKPSLSSILCHPPRKSSSTIYAS